MAEGVHSPQPKLQPHQSSSPNGLILFQVKAFVLVSLMLPLISSCCLHAHFLVFQASLRKVFLEALYLNQQNCPIYYSPSQHSIYFFYATDRNLGPFISLTLLCWTVNSQKAGIMCALYFSYLSECLTYGMCAILLVEC